MLTVSEALKRTEGESIPHLEGKIVHVGKYKQSVNTIGEPYSSQVIDICDPEHPKAKLSVRLEDFSEVTAEEKGKVAVLRGHELTTGGFAGVVLVANPVFVLNDPADALAVIKGKKGKKSSLMVVARKAEKAYFGVEEEDGSPVEPKNTPANAPESPETHQKPEPLKPYYRESELAEKANAEAAKTAKVNALSEVFKTMGKFMNVHRMALACADKIGEERKAAGLTFTEAHHEKIASSLAMCVTMRNQAPQHFPTESWEAYRDDMKRKPAKEVEAKP